MSDLAGDALAMVVYLRNRREIAAAHIGIIGGSLGGDISFAAAARSRDVNFVVSLSGFALPGRDVFVQQHLALSRLTGFDKSQPRKLSAEIDVRSYIYSLAATNLSAEEIRAKASEWRNTQEKGHRLTIDELDDLIRRATVPLRRSILGYDPRVDLKHLVVPVLTINGDLDWWVSAEGNLPALKAALSQSGNRDTTIMLLKSHNHGLQKCNEKGMSVDSDAIDPAVLSSVTEWIRVRSH